MLTKCNSNNVMLLCTLSFYLMAISVLLSRILNQTSFCKKLAEVIVILNRASSIDKHTRKKPKYLPVPAFARVVPKKQLKQC